MIIFRCDSGLVPMPDSIEGCVECLIDKHCGDGKICEVQWNQCIPKPDPCNPSPCGPGSICMEDFNGNAICRFFLKKFFCIIETASLLKKCMALFYETLTKIFAGI